MANPIFNALNTGNNMLGMLSQLRQNPTALLQQAGLKIPANINGPQQIVEYLTRTGQISQNQLNQAQQMAQMLNIK